MFRPRTPFLHVLCRSALAVPQIPHAVRLVALVAVAACTLFAQSASPATVDPAVLQRYHHDVVPVLQANCLRCHGGMNRRSGYSMSTRAAAIAGGHHGIAIVPGQPDNSLLVKLIGAGPYPDDIKPMPLKGKLTDAEIATLRRWVAEGAVMDQ